MPTVLVAVVLHKTVSACSSVVSVAPEHGHLGLEVCVGGVTICVAAERELRKVSDSAPAQSVWAQLAA